MDALNTNENNNTITYFETDYQDRQDNIKNDNESSEITFNKDLSKSSDKEKVIEVYESDSKIDENNKSCNHYNCGFNCDYICDYNIQNLFIKPNLSTSENNSDSIDKSKIFFSSSEEEDDDDTSGASPTRARGATLQDDTSSIATYLSNSTASDKYSYSTDYMQNLLKDSEKSNTKSNNSNIFSKFIKPKNKVNISIKLDDLERNLTIKIGKKLKIKM
jgi:hypothetical protein